MLPIFFIVGLIVGSFLNVVICRLDLAESIVSGRSHCPKCKSTIKWYDNIPVISFVMLRAKCRECMKDISWQYPFIEILTGVVFVLAGQYIFVEGGNAWVETFFYLAILSLMIVVVGYDIKFMEIPMIIIWISILLALVLHLFVDWKNFELMASESFWSFSTASGLLGGVIAAAFFYFLVFVSKEKWMGMGDVYVGFLAGLLVGFPSIFFSLFISFTAGSVFGIILMMVKKGNLKTQIPFAPFLILGAVFTLFFKFSGTSYYLSQIFWFF